MRKVFFVISFNFLFFNVHAQINDSENDLLLIQKTLNLYIDGQATGDSVMVGKSFHSSWQLKYLADDKMNIVGKSQYLSGFKTPYRRQPNWSGRIISIDITNQIASAKIEISTTKLLFIDYFNLMKTTQGWFIVDKISTRTPHKTIVETTPKS